MKRCRIPPLPPAPFTQKAGPGYADYDLSTEWIATRQGILEAQQRWADPASPSRVLLLAGIVKAEIFPPEVRALGVGLS
jgi:hypothetical protein